MNISAISQQNQWTVSHSLTFSGKFRTDDVFGVLFYVSFHCSCKWSGCISAMSHLLWPKSEVKVSILKPGLLELQFERTQGRKIQDAPVIWFLPVDPQIVFAKYLRVPTDISSWHCIWHTTRIWHVVWHYLWHVFWHSMWQECWHGFWLSIWDTFWQIGHVFSHSAWHIWWVQFIWHIFRPSIDTCFNMLFDMLFDLIWYDMIYVTSMCHLSMQYLYHFYRTLRKPNICQKNINPLDILFVPTSNHIYKYFLFFFLQPPLVGCYPNVKQSCLVEIWSYLFE